MAFLCNTNEAGIVMLREKYRHSKWMKFNKNFMYLREIVATLQPSDVPVPDLVPICEGVTGKGTHCRNRASPDSCYCRMHGDRPPRPSKVPRVKKPPKPKKIQPEHTHGIDEIGVNCPLCETHGNVWDPGLTDCCFGGDDIKILTDDKDGCTI